MFFFHLALHRMATLLQLRWLLLHKCRNPAYSPVAGRILYVAASCRPYHITGYTSRTHDLLYALKNAGADMRVVTRTGYPWDRRDSLCLPETETSQVDGILYQHFRSPRNNRFTATYAAQASPVLEHYARQERINVIHAASNHVNALPALIAARRLGIPFQYEMRGLWELSRASRMPAFENSPNFRLGLELEGLVASLADRIYVISQQLGYYAQEHWNIPAERIRLLPNCVDGERITPDSHVDIFPNSIGYAGTLIGYEGLDILIQAVAILRQKGTPVHLHIVGDGEVKTDLVALTAKLGLQNTVHFFGRMSPEAARSHMNRCTLICLPRKPFAVCRIIPPIKLAEALALGKPVVVPNLPVFQDELGMHPAGWFFRAGDVEHLAEVLSAALADPARLAKLGTQGRAYVLTHRQWKGFVNNVLHPEINT